MTTRRPFLQAHPASDAARPATPLLDRIRRRTAIAAYRVHASYIRDIVEAEQASEARIIARLDRICPTHTHITATPEREAVSPVITPPLIAGYLTSGD